MSTTVFLGGGRITAALVAGQRGSGYRGRIVVYDRNPDKVRRLRREFRVEGARNAHEAAEQAAQRNRKGASGLLVIAVRPADVMPLLETIGALARRTLVVSLAAGIPLHTLRRALGPHAEWARAMPSPAARAGLGLTAVAFDRAVRPEGRRQVREFFARVGAVLEIPERQFDAFTVVYSTSQGLEALRARVRAARRLGLDSATANAAVAHSLADGIRALGGEWSELDRALAEAATPGGIAARVVEEMRRAGYQRVVERGFRAGMAQAQGMRGKGRTG